MSNWYHPKPRKELLRLLKKQGLEYQMLSGVGIAIALARDPESTTREKRQAQLLVATRNLRAAQCAVTYAQVEVLSARQALREWEKENKA